jgi:hypothetical protein
MTNVKGGLLDEYIWKREVGKGRVMGEINMIEI